MYRTEKNALTCQPRLYGRYIDDIFLAIDSNDEMESAFEALNHQCDSIRLTIERPDEEGWISFLDTQVRVGNKVETRWYRKPSNRNILLHKKSAHPMRMKSNIISNTLARVNIASSREHLKTSKNLALKIIENNGYHIDLSKKRLNNRTIRSSVKNLKKGPILKIPFICEKFTREIQKCIKAYNLPIQVVTIPPPNLRKMLMRTRFYEPKTCHLIRKACEICDQNQLGDCKRIGCVYELKCQCGECYIGQTAGAIWHRFDQHMSALRNPDTPSNQSNALVRHFKESPNHTDGVLPKFSITILESNLNQGYVRLVTEAQLIKSQKPSLNGKNEMEGVELLL